MIGGLVLCIAELKPGMRRSPFPSAHAHVLVNSICTSGQQIHTSARPFVTVGRWALAVHQLPRLSRAYPPGKQFIASKWASQRAKVQGPAACSGWFTHRDAI